MAKRRKLEAPSVEDLSRLEEEFRQDTARAPVPGLAPIAQVAAEAAGALDARSSEDRLAHAKDRADAEKLREATAAGRVIGEVAMAEIAADSMIRDRTLLDEAELQELTNSIAAHGMRLPIEIYELPQRDGQGHRYGLLSGYRRYLATQRLSEMTGGRDFTHIKALVRDPEAMGGSITAMVEENEVRASLSPYERGRIAVIAAQNGAFVNVEAAVNTLFGTASKAKRSKIRSFAQVFEELGDMLRFPEDMSEKQGLMIATALRAGGEAGLRRALEDCRADAFEDEWAAMETVLSDAAPAPRNPSRGGRPKKKTAAPGWTDDNTLVLSTGWTLVREEDSRSPYIRIEGREISRDVMEDVMNSIRRALEVP